MNFKNIFLVLTILLSVVLSINSVHADVGATLIWDATADSTLSINRGQSAGFMAMFDSLGERANNYKVELLRNNVVVGPVLLNVNNQAGDHHAYQLTIQSGQYGRRSGQYVVRSTITGLTSGRTRTATLNLNVVNHAPVAADSPLSQSAAEGSLLTFPIGVTDADNDVLMYTINNAPRGLTFNNGTFTWTPNYNQAGDYIVTFTATDGTGRDSKTVRITVNDVNRVPVLVPIGNKQVNEGANLNFRIYATDADNDALTYSVTGLPLGAAFTAATRTFDWTPSRTQSGVYTVTFTATDSVDTSSEVITITVIDVDRAPVIAPIGDKNVNEGTHLNFPVTATDVNNDVISLTTSVLPLGATFVGGVFDWTPDFTQTGVYTVTFIATDSTSMSSSETITITVTNVNRAPVLNPIGNKVVDELVNLNFPVTATDPDSDAVVVTATNLPSGATFVAGIFSWTPDRTQSGVYTVTFTVTDSVDTSSEVITITVNDIDRAPVIAPIGNRVVNEGTHLNFPVTATDVNNDVISLTTSVLPLGATFVGGVFDWTPDFTQTGVYTVTFTATDSNSMSSSETITITVNNVNHAPVFDPIVDQTVAEGNLLRFTVHATDSDGDALTYSATSLPLGLPAGATFDPATQQFAWTPDFTQSGSYPITFTVSDGSVPATTATITITVTNVNRAPVFDAIVDRTVSEGTPLEFTVHATDVDNSALTYWATDVPVGAIFDPATQTFTWTPDFTQSGIYVVTFTVNDRTVHVSETITITVTNNNRNPILDPVVNRRVTVGNTVTFTIYGEDPDNDPITFDAVVPAGATFDPVTRIFSWTPVIADIGDNIITFIVSDGYETDTTETIISVVAVNHEPTISPIGDQDVNEGQTLTLPVTFTDEDGNPLRVGISTHDLPSAPRLDIVDANNVNFVWTAGFEDAGVYHVTFQVNDGEYTVDQTVQITVHNVNRAPVIDPVIDQTVAEGNLLQFTVRATDADVDRGETVTLTATGLPLGATFNPVTGNPATQTFSWTPDFTQVGFYVVTFQATDGTIPVSTATMTIIVTNTNQAPVFDAMVDQTVAEGVLVQFTVHATDADLDGITYNARNLPVGATFDPATQQFSWTTGFDQEGVYTVTFIANDGHVNTEEDVIITVGNVNRAPVFDVITNQNVAEGTLLQFTVHATDADNDVLTYSASGLPTGATFDPATQQFSWTPDFTQSGSYPITFSVSDGSVPVTTVTITITVTNGNRAPVLAAIGNKHTNENVNLNFQISATDADGDALTYSATSLPLGATFTAATRTFDWTPSRTQSGPYAVTFTVTDSNLISTSETITITVDDVDRAPVLANIGNKVVNEGVNLNFRVTATDPNSDAIILTATGLPAGATFNAATGTFDWTPGFTQSGVYRVTFTATDSTALSTSETITITVNNINQVPEIRSRPIDIAREGELYNYQIVVSDDDTLTYTLYKGQ